MFQNNDIINILLSYEVITQEQIAQAEKRINELIEKENASKIGGEPGAGQNREIGTTATPPLEEILVELNFISWEHIAAALSHISGIPYVKLENYDLTEELVLKIPEKLARRHNLIAIQQDEDKLVVAIANPNNLAALDDISLMLGYYVEAVIAPKDEILAAIARFYTNKEEENFQDVLANLNDDDVSVIDASLSSSASDAPKVETKAVQWVKSLIKKALQDRSSDVHLEPFQKSFRVRERVDGVLLPVPPPPLNLKSSIISRIKVMADLNIADTRMPQDGTIRLKLPGKNIDLRVACLPTVNGESVVMRVLDKSSVLLSMSDLGLSEHIEKAYRKALSCANGIIMVTGPTGCGKTTTLYAGMIEINDLQSKVITVEDPVEYEIYGMMQCQVNDKIGMSFANALRSILRQDPDIILIGEMRDPETAGIAIESALTGHLVLSTTHTNEAAGTVTRLIDMGCEPFLITSTLQTVIGQRLVRTICPNCKDEYKPDRSLFLKLGKRPEDYPNQIYYKGRGCEQCARTGYYGRTGLFEVFEMREALIDLIVKKAPANVLHAKALELGMIPMREDGWFKVLAGKTTLEEVTRVAPIEPGVSIIEG